MSLPAVTSPAGRRSWHAFAGWVWIAVLLASYGVVVYKSIPRNALELPGEEMGIYTIFLGFLIALLLTLTALYWFVDGVMHLRAKRHDKWIPWIRLSTMVAVWGGISFWVRHDAQKNPITADSESVYLVIAAMAREHLGKANAGSWFYIHPNGEDDLGSAISDDVRKQFDAILPAYWSRFQLKIGIDGGCVVVSRGSGMLGEVGLRIYDRGPVVLYSVDETRKNPWLPDQKRITDRMWYFRSG